MTIARLPFASTMRGVKSSDDWKPCPFCGRAPHHLWHFEELYKRQSGVNIQRSVGVSCPCGATIAVQAGDDDEEAREELLERWNRRDE